MENCPELQAGIKQLLDYDAVLLCFEHIQHKVNLADLVRAYEKAAYQKGLEDAKAALQAKADYHGQKVVDLKRDNIYKAGWHAQEQGTYQKAVKVVEKLREGASAIDALGQGKG